MTIWNSLPVRAADDTDAIAGVPARFVATPASTHEASEVIRTAARHDLSIVVRGAGTKQEWGNPPERLDLVLDTEKLTGVVEHAAGDLIAVVRAGTPLAGLQHQLAEASQQLALDDPVGGATVGGAVAVNTSGPRRMAYGTVRDLIIGVTLIRPDGVIAKAGGKVVKNVAGYDLSKLMTGSYGTLGLIAECAFRLHPIPPSSTVVRTTVDSPREVGSIVRAVLGSQLVPAAMEVDGPPGGPLTVAVQLIGVPVGVRERGEVLRKLIGGEQDGAAPEWFGVLPWRAADVGLKLTAALSRVPEVLAVRGQELHLRGSIGTGVLYAGLPPGADIVSIVDDLRAVCEHAVVLTAPPGARERLDLWGPVPGLQLMRQVKAQFDPARRFAPGRFAGGI